MRNFSFYFRFKLAVVCFKMVTAIVDGFQLYERNILFHRISKPVQQDIELSKQLAIIMVQRRYVGGEERGIAYACRLTRRCAKRYSTLLYELGLPTSISCGCAAYEVLVGLEVTWSSAGIYLAGPDYNVRHGAARDTGSMSCVCVRVRACACVFQYGTTLITPHQHFSGKPSHTWGVTELKQALDLQRLRVVRQNTAVRQCYQYFTNFWFL